VSRDDV